ncbi:hypothetical protein [Sulfobacillus thermosulfidooxidans]|uniref:hypothetical protein n=1 Tax=Sulfobacillus thermosulfidooxidans TaxID=28034 RepID=UPI0006B472A5|nr:hypothetical protein [Sulfobacillus thermosulfidooxidans]
MSATGFLVPWRSGWHQARTRESMVHCLVSSQYSSATLCDLLRHYAVVWAGLALLMVGFGNFLVESYLTAFW